MTEAPRPKPDAATGACPTCGYALCDSRECEPPSAPAGAPEPSGELPAYRCDDGHTFAGTPVCEDCGVSARQLEPDHRRMLAAMKRAESAESESATVRAINCQLRSKLESAESESARLRAQLQSAEAQIEAVRAELDAPGVGCLASLRDRIETIVNPATSPGAGEGKL